MNSTAAPPVRLKVFLVEDNEDTRVALAHLLQGSGYDVRSAATMNAALREFDGSNVLLSDLGLPDGDGWELLQALRRAGHFPYAVAISGFGAVSDVATSAQAGFRHHLVKPIDLDELERLLEEARQEVEGSL